MEEICSSEPSVQTQRDTRRHITEHGTPCRISLNTFFSLKMEALLSSETSVETERATRRHILEDGTACRFSLNLIIHPWRCRRYVPPKRRWRLNGLHGVIFQNTFLCVGFRSTYVFHREDGGDMYFRNVGWNSTGYTASYSRRRYCLSVFAALNSSTLKMGAICSSEPSVQTQRDTRRNITEDDTPCRISQKLCPPPWSWRRYVSPNRRLKLNGLHGVIFQKMVLVPSFHWTYFFCSEDGGDIFVRNVGWNSTGCTASYSRRRYCFSVFAELIYSTLNMMVICFSETSDETQRATRRLIPEDVTACLF
jgi:hypothetical protein